MKKVLIIGANSYIAKKFIVKFNKIYQIFSVSHKQNKNHLILNELNSKHIDIIKSIDIVINLAGSNIGEKRWNKRKKQEILASRIDTTDTIVNLLNKFNPKAHLINFSAIGIYDTNKKQDEYNEIIYTKYNNFSQEITKKWEIIANKYLGNLTIVRLGVVINNDSSTYKKLISSFKFGFGIIFNNGTQYFSWIALEDLLNAIDFIIKNNTFGIINLTAPNPLTNNNLSKLIAKKYKTKILIKMPKFIIQLLLGQMGIELLINSLEVYPAKLNELGFKFKYPNFNQFLDSI